MLNLALPAGAAIAFGLLAALVTLEAGRRARWSASTFEHFVWAIATAFVFLGQQMHVRLPGELELHYVGAGFLALLVGYPRAIVSLAGLYALQALASEDYGTWGLRLLIEGLTPVWTMSLIVGACKRWLPRNLFVFLLGCGLFGLFASYATSLVAAAAIHQALAPTVPIGFWSDFVPYALLLATGESWLEGMLVTLLVVYVPGSVRLFDEGFYLARPG